jgi:hypothetical protein
MRLKAAAVAVVVLALGIVSTDALSARAHASSSVLGSITALSPLAPLDDSTTIEPPTASTGVAATTATTAIPATTIPTTTTIPVTTTTFPRATTTVPVPRTTPPTIPPKPKPKPAQIVRFVASPPQLPYTGGKSILTVKVTRAQTCTFTSRQHIKGSPLTVKCVSGASIVLQLGRNTQHSNEVVTINIFANGPGGKSGVDHVAVTVLRAPSKPHPVSPPPTTPPVTTPPTTPSTTPPTTATCYPLTDGGNCYEPGEFCRNSDHGKKGIAGDGDRIVCEDNDGWRWEPY